MKGASKVKISKAGLSPLRLAQAIAAVVIADMLQGVKIITRGVLDWDGNVLEEESYIHRGAVALCSALGRPILTTTQLQNHLTQVGAISDVIWAPLYDANSYAAAGQLQLNFFSTPQGQGTTTAPGATGVKTNADTNMTAAGQLTMGNDFYMTGQEILFFPGENPGVQETGTAIGNFVNDTWVVSKSGVLTLTIGSNRQYISDGPLGQFPPLTRLAVATAVSGTGATSTNTNEVSYAAFSGTPYSITPVYITATLGFQEVITWPAKVTVTNAAVIYSRLDGYLIRNAQ
jgi:hypothetical protein